MYKSRPIFILTIISVILVTTSCKDNSTGSDDPSIVITNITSSLLSLNECNIDSGLPASEFLFEVDFDANSDIEIDGVEFDLIFIGGGESPNRFSDDFDLSNEGLEFDWCFRFANTEGVELILKILANDETLESNEVTIKVDKPEGANKTTG